MDTLETKPSGIFINGPVSCWNVKASFFRWVSFMISFESFQFIYYVREFFVFYAIWHVFNFDEITSIYFPWTILPSSKYFFCKVEEPVSCSLSLTIKFWLWIMWWPVFRGQVRNNKTMWKKNTILLEKWFYHPIKPV